MLNLSSSLVLRREAGILRGAYRLFLAVMVTQGQLVAAKGELVSSGSAATIGWIVVLLLCAFAFGVWGAGADTLWYDEWYSVYYAGASPFYEADSLADTVRRTAETYHELNPPLYYMALHGWSRIAGEHPFTLRLLSVLMALIALAFMYRIGRDLHSAAAGVCALLIAAGSALFITYTHEARAYMLLVLCAAAALWAYGRLALRSRPAPTGTALLFAASLIALPYTHYLSIPLILALAGYHVVFAPRQNWWRVTVIAALSLSAFAAWLPVAGKAFLQTAGDPSRDALSRDAVTLIIRLTERFGSGSPALYGLFGILGIGAMRTNPRLRMIGITGVAGLVIALALNERARFITDVHYLLAFLPVLAGIGGVGLARMGQFRGAAAAVWLAAGLWTTLSPMPRSVNDVNPYIAWDALDSALADRTAPGDTLIYLLPPPDPNWFHAPVIDYYLRQRQLDLRLLESLPDLRPETMREQVVGFTATNAPVWVAYSDAQPPSAFARQEMDRWMTEAYVRCEPLSAFGSMRAALHIPQRQDGGVAFAYGADTAALSVALADASVTPNGTLRVLVMTNAAPDFPVGAYSLGLHLDDAAGELVRQQDAGFTAPACRVDVFDLTGLPPGRYTLHAVVYDWATGERLGTGMTDRPILAAVAF
ncbi:MAG: glycosyltransferase family 39 protein [bacterium]|nr:glycosyltransferase family 39 protein [bacterium]